MNASISSLGQSSKIPILEENCGGEKNDDVKKKVQLCCNIFEKRHLMIASSATEFK
jgi:hypothetical protein